MVNAGSIKRMKVLFAGRVQGVGFRFTVCRLASAFNVTGYVKNLMDGNVEMVAEGIDTELIDLLNEIKYSHLGRYITRETVSWSPATGKYSTFGVSY